MTPVPAMLASRSVVPRSTLKVRRSRLLMPITDAPASTARAISAALFTSTSGSIPSSRDSAIRRTSAESSSAATMSRTESAPFTRASSTWYSSTRKSLRRTAGRASPIESMAARTAVMSSSVPLNQVGSVRTEIPAAPPLAYFSAWAVASISGAMSPLLGEARFTSAMTAIGRSRRSRSAKSSGSGAEASCC